MRIQSGLGERGADVGQQLRTLELASRQVDAHRGCPAWVGKLPGGGLAAGLHEHPLAQRHDQARLLGHRDEIDRRDEAALGMLPADQRFDFDDALFVVVQREDGLVEHPKLAPLERPVQVGLERQTLGRAVGHAQVEHLEAIAARLGAAHGSVRFAEERLGGVAQGY